MMLAQKLLETAGNAVTTPVYVEDVFSTYLYTSTGSNQTIVNGIDLATKGGLVWVKGRNAVKDNVLVDTARGVSNSIVSNTTNGQDYSSGNYVNAFNADGFGVGGIGSVGGTNNTFASWTFRKQPKFFDVQTATTNGSSNYGSTVPSMTIAHNLGSIPGCVIVKRTDGTGGFYTWHRGLASTLYYVSLNTTSASAPYGGNVNGTGGWIQATSTHIYLDAWFNTYEPGNYVVYIFAHDAGGFGLTGTDNVISCGSYTEGSSDVTVSLGYEPAWILVKPSSTTGNWNIYDTMRGAALTGNTAVLRPNTSDAEAYPANYWYPTSTGFVAKSGNYGSGQTIIYIAIRRGPMKVPTSGTSVFSPQVQTPTGSTSYVMAGSSGFPIDWLPTKQKNTVVDWYQTSRLTNNYMSPNTTAAEGAYTYGFDLMQGVSAQWSTNSTVSYAFRRAPSFFDVVCYTGTGSARTVTHNLGVAPEMMIVKVRDSATDWAVYHSGIGATKRLILNLTDTPYTSATAGWNDTAPTASVFTVGTNVNVNGNGYLYVAYLFATCPGVSKVGSYTGTGSSLTIDCGFTSGARFVMIKCTTQAYDWMVFDTAKGINSATEPFLVINSNNAQNTISSGSIYDLDWIDPHSTGFTLPNNYGYVNASGENYIYLAIA